MQSIEEVQSRIAHLTEFVVLCEEPSQRDEAIAEMIRLCSENDLPGAIASVDNLLGGSFSGIFRTLHPLAAAEWDRHQMRLAASHGGIH